MKKISVATLIFFAILFLSEAVTAQGILSKIKEKTKQRADAKIDQSIDKSLDKAEGAGKNKSNEENNSSNQNHNTTEPRNGTDQPAGIKAQDNYTITAFQNYDFIPGDKIIFADDFSSDQMGEFPSHWGLVKGQGTVNRSGDKIAFSILNGNYAVVKPLVKSKDYLEDAFTTEFDYFINNGADCGYGIQVWMVDEKGEDNKGVDIGRYKTASTSYLNTIAGMNDLSGTEVKQSDESFYNHWHHIAIAYKKPQMKVYIDQNRVLVVPNLGFTPKSLLFGGLAGDENCPISIANVRVANGGSQNMLSSIFTNGNIFSTHGITFDIDKATIKPESMGVLNQVATYLKQNASVKMEIDGHTDNSGNAAHNLTLSQQRADAVKTQLVSMGIDGSRLSTKGLGDTKPLNNNETPEGKANNRRVEFIKM